MFFLHIRMGFLSAFAITTTTVVATTILLILQSNERMHNWRKLPSSHMRLIHMLVL